jgi:hypothetical protein
MILSISGSPFRRTTEGAESDENAEFRGAGSGPLCVSATGSAFSASLRFSPLEARDLTMTRAGR